MRSETAVGADIVLSASYSGNVLWRNNVGALKDVTGRPVRYGLANMSKKTNEKIKSSDKIGITKVVITPDMVGQVVGVFTAIEDKKEGWKYRESDKRAKAQKKFHDIVLEKGGYAGFATCVEDYRKIIGHDF